MTNNDEPGLPSFAKPVTKVVGNPIASGIGGGGIGRGKRAAPGFGGFKAPPATDLIDQLLLEQD